MDIKDVCDAGSEIFEAVADAVGRNDYRGLSRSVGNTVSRVMDQAEQEIKFKKIELETKYRNGDKYKDLYKNGRMTNYRDPDSSGGNGANRHAEGSVGNPYASIYVKGSYQAQRQMPGYRTDTSSGRSLPAVAKLPAGRIMGPIQLGWGVLGTTGFGTVAVASTAMAVTAKTFDSALVAVAIVFGILSACTISDIVRGYGKISLIKRFRHYADLIGDRGFISVEELAVMAGRKSEAVLKDIKKMIRRRMFPQGRLDAKETTFMLTNDAYEQYRVAENERRRREAQEQLSLQEVQRQNQSIQQNQNYDDKTKKILSEGNDYIRMVRDCNDRIPDEAMSEKLFRLERIMRRIFEQVEKNPESADDLHKFMTFYLPTTKKLLNAYVDLDKQEVSGENMSRTKKEIEDTLDTINAAFEKLLDSLFEDTAWDISSDISVMKTMLAQEGLTGQGFPK